MERKKTLIFNITLYCFSLMGVSTSLKGSSIELESEVSLEESSVPDVVQPERQFQSLMQSISLPKNEITNLRRKQDPFKFLSNRDSHKYTLVANEKTSEGSYFGFTNKDKKPDYKGLLLFNDNQIYEGEFNNGEITGLGRKFIDQDSMYEGMFVQGKYCGKGTLYGANGAYCTAIWEDSKPNGQGKERLEDGTLYDGEYRKGVKEGKGQLIFTDGSKYRGDFKNDHPEGEGEFIENNGKKITGDFVKGYPHGFCREEHINNTVYIGEFKNGQKHGKGKLIKNGQEINGEWAYDELELEEPKITNSNNIQ